VPGIRGQSALNPPPPHCKQHAKLTCGPRPQDSSEKRLTLRQIKSHISQQPPTETHSSFSESQQRLHTRQQQQPAAASTQSTRHRPTRRKLERIAPPVHQHSHYYSPQRPSRVDASSTVVSLGLCLPEFARPILAFLRVNSLASIVRCCVLLCSVPLPSIAGHKSYMFL
jgi:hypothetical protein